MRERRAVVWAVAATAMLPRLWAAPDASQARDAALMPTTGTASVAGVVMDDRDPARPVRRAVVTLTGAGLRPNRGAITDDDGRFSIRGLPAGRFTLAAERGAYVTSVYGSKRPGRPGTEIVVADGQQVADLRVRLWRGAVIAGVLRDETGLPLRGMPVAAVPARAVTAAGLTLSNNARATTNDLGEYRVFGLEPGTYLVRAGNAGQIGQPELAVSEAEVDAALAALAARSVDADRGADTRTDLCQAAGCRQPGADLLPRHAGRRRRQAYRPLGRRGARRAGLHDCAHPDGDGQRRRDRARRRAGRAGLRAALGGGRVG